LRGAAFTLFVLWMTAGRALSATWTAPPPRSAPPAVQAHNLARAIRTDMGDPLLLILTPSSSAGEPAMTKELFPSTKKTKESCYFNAVNPEYDREAMEKADIKPTSMVNVPKWNDGSARSIVRP
jgi:hypothetical protein